VVVDGYAVASNRHVPARVMRPDRAEARRHGNHTGRKISAKRIIAAFGTDAQSSDPLLPMPKKMSKKPRT